MRASSITDRLVPAALAPAANAGALTGLMIVSILPALFWTALIAGIGSLFGQAPSAQSLGLLAASIAAFLGLVFAALRTRAE